MLGLALGAAVAVGAGATGYQSMAPTGQWFGRAFHGVSFRSQQTRSKQIALTFDDGPNDPHTLRLLEVLARHNVHATFFMIGRYAQQRPDIDGADILVEASRLTEPEPLILPPKLQSGAI